MLQVALANFNSEKNLPRGGKMFCLNKRTLQNQGKGAAVTHDVEKKKFNHCFINWGESLVVVWGCVCTLKVHWVSYTVSN